VKGKDLNLRVHVGQVFLRNPIILSPGPFGRTPLSMKHFADAGCAAVCSKTLSSEPWEGNPDPKKMNLECGWMLNAEGEPNIGIEAFSEMMKQVRPEIKESHVIISIVGKSIREFVSLAVEAERMGADILDLDITCPNAVGKGTTDSWQKDLGLLHDLIAAVKEAVSIPLWIKCISAYGTLLEIAKTLETAGADAVVPLVSVGAMAVDVETGKPRLGFRFQVSALPLIDGAARTKKHGARGKAHGEEVGGQCSAQQLAAEVAGLIEQETSCKYIGFHKVIYEVSNLMAS